MTKYILTIFISLVSIYSFSQEKISITGKVTDALNLPLTDSEITIGNKADSTKIATTTTDETGAFKIDIEPQENPLYIIVEDALEGVFKKSLESLKNSIDLGTIVINPMVYDLKEVVVTKSA